MRTTINISDALLGEIKDQAARQSVPFRVVLENALHTGLAQIERSEIAHEPFRVEPWMLGLKAAYHGVSLNQLADQIEAEDVAR